MRDMIPITVIADEEQLFSDKLSVVLVHHVDTMHDAPPSGYVSPRTNPRHAYIC